MKPSRPGWHIACVMAPIVAALVAMAPVVVHPASIGGGDLEMMFLPLWRFLGTSVRAGRVPLWMPSLGGGFPFVAYLQSQALYPPALLLFAALPLEAAAVAFMVVHLAWAGLGTAWLARRFAHEHLAAVCVAVLVAASPVLLGAVVRPNVLAAASWLPWIAAAAHRTIEGGRGCVVALSACFACGLLAGSPEVVTPAWIAAGVLAVAAARRRAWPSVGRVALGIALGGMLALPSLLPFAELLAHSSRDPHGTVWSLRPTELAGLIVPLLPATPYASETEWFGGPVQRLLPILYLGAPALLLGVVALWRREEHAVRWAVVVAAGLALAMLGGLTNHLVMAAHLPSLRWRYPIKLVLPAVFGAALLAVSGASALARLPWGRLGIVAGAVGGAAAVLGACTMGDWGIGAVSCFWIGASMALLALLWRWARRVDLAVAAMTAVCLLDALAAGWTHRLPPTAHALDCDVVWARLSELAAGGRVWVVDPAPPYDALASVGDERLPPDYRRALCLSGDRSARYGVDTASMYGSPLLGAHDALLDRTGPRGAALLGATIAAAWSPSALGDLPRIDSPWAPAVLARIPGAAPRVSLADTVALAEAPPAPTAPGGSYEGSDTARLVRDEGAALEVETASSATRFLVLADVAYPGWEAEVDGVEAPVTAAYGAVRAVHLGPGRHRVRFAFHSSSFRLGLVGAAIAIVVLAWITFARRRGEQLT